MDLLASAVLHALRLLLTGDAETWQITLLSLRVSLTATAISVLVVVPLGTWLALVRFPGRGLLLALVNTGMDMPPVVAGLVITILLWRALPVVIGLTVAAIQQRNPRLRLQILALGATRWQYLALLVREARLPLLAAVMAGFGAVISEVGAAMMVGGNIQGQTRVLTTATVLETSKGNFDVALALGLILLALVYAVNLT